MKYIYIDKFNFPADDFYEGISITEFFDAHYSNDEDALKYIRKEYKAGNSAFTLYIPEDSEILTNLATLRNSGRMRHLTIKVHIYTSNKYKFEDFINTNKDWVTKE